MHFLTSIKLVRTSKTIKYKTLTYINLPIINLANLVKIIEKGGGRNVDDQNVDRPKISERRNGLFS